MMKSSLPLILILCGLIGFAACDSEAGLASKGLREVAEFVLRKSGKQVTKRSVRVLTERLGKLQVRYGDDAIRAIRKTGPAGLQAIESAGHHAPQVVKLMSRYGNEAMWVVARKRGMAIFIKHGDDAARAMIKHKGIAGSLITRYQRPAVGALTQLSGRGGRRLAMLADDSVRWGPGQFKQLLGVIGKHGESALNFVWRNKGSLAVASLLTSFLANPELYLDTVTDVVKEPVRKVNWTLLAVLGLLLVSIRPLFRLWRSRRGRPANSEETSQSRYHHAGS